MPREAHLVFRLPWHRVVSGVSGCIFPTYFPPLFLLPPFHSLSLSPLSLTLPQQTVTTILTDIDEIQTVTTTASDINERQLIQTNMVRRSEKQVYQLSAPDVRGGLVRGGGGVWGGGAIPPHLLMSHAMCFSAVHWELCAFANLREGNRRTSPCPAVMMDSRLCCVVQMPSLVCLLWVAFDCRPGWVASGAGG